MHKKKILLKKAHDEAEKLKTINQRRLAFKAIADFYIDSDQNKSLEYYKRVLNDIKKHETNSTFLFLIYSLVKALFFLKQEIGLEIANEIYEKIGDFDFGKNFIESTEWKSKALFWSAVGFWKFNKKKGINIMNEAVVEYTKRTSVQWPMWAYYIAYSCYELIHDLNVDIVKEIIREILNALPCKRREEFIDTISLNLCEFDEAEEPLQKYGVYQNRLSNNTKELVKFLLPFCSKNAAAKSHLALCISNWEIDDQEAHREINFATKIAEESEKTLSDSIFKDIFLTYAVVKGLNRCLYSVKMLSLKNKRFSEVKSNIYELVIDNIKERKEYIIELWNAVKSTDKYLY